MVYFARVFKVSGVKSFWVILFCLVSFIIGGPGLGYCFGGRVMIGAYYDVCRVVFIWVIGVLLFFMNFVRYFLGGRGALRSV